MTRGLVVGKFYPPHRGHKHLIDTAAAQVDHLDVLLCWRDDQQIPGTVRTAWLREIHAQTHIRIHSVWDFGDDDNSDAWARCAVETIGYAPDLVFSSEDYGPRFAACLGARHVLVDRARHAVPISGTAVRRDPLAAWSFLDAPVRAWYAVRVAVVGAESTGTTTLARSLAEYYRTEWVPEFGRAYSAALVATGTAIESYQWRSDEFVHIAHRQLELEDAAARRCNRLLVCDTDALATTIWHERYMGFASDAVRTIAAGRSYALHILTDCDIPFEQDGLRDGEHKREWMTGRFRDELGARGGAWIVVRGPHTARMDTAVAAIERLLAARTDVAIR
jgi:HTH-type transcriptional repressor of NAD biosynthesis genes